MANGVLTGVAGVATNISDWLRSADTLKVGNNVNMVKRGIITSRYNGWQRQRAGAFNAGAAFLDFALFVGTTGTTTQIFQVGDSVYSYDGATETAIFSGVNSSALPCMRMFAPYNVANAYLIWCNGVDEPKKITGTGGGAHALLQINGANYGAGGTAAPLAVKTYSKPTYCEPFYDRMVFAGFTGGTMVNDVLISNAGLAEVCTASTPLVATDGGVFQVSPALGKITGLKSFKLSNEGNDQVLLIAQERGVSIITGRDALNFRMLRLTTEYGIPSNRTWIQIQNDLFFLATDGVRSFKALASNANLMNATMTFLLQDIINRFSASSLAKAHAVHVAKYQEIQFFFPIDGGATCTAALVMNYNAAGDPTAVDPIWFTRDNASVACSQYYGGHMYGGSYDGILQDHYTVNTVDGAACSWELVFSHIRGDNPKVPTLLESAMPICEGAGQKFLANTSFYAKDRGGNTVLRQAQPVDRILSAVGGGGTVLDAWSLGSGAFPADHLKFLDYFPRSLGLGHQLGFRGTDSTHVIDLLGVIWEATEAGTEAAK